MRKLIAVFLLFCFLMGAVMPARAMTSTEKEDNYGAAILELETYLENSGNSSEALSGIAAALAELSGYEQSKFLGYYVSVLRKIADENYDQMMLLYLDMMSNPLFEQYLNGSLKASAIRPVAELKRYAQGREFEHKGQAEEAVAAYRECLGFPDAADRYYALQSTAFQRTYDDAVKLLLSEDYVGAYFLFKSIPKHEDSEIYMNSIVNLLGYVPSSPTDRLTPVTGLRATGINRNQITVEWDASPHAAEYAVSYKPQGAANWTAETTTAGTGITLDGLLQETVYTVQVVAKNGAFFSGSAAITARTAAPTPAPTAAPRPTPTPRPLRLGQIVTFGRYAETDLTWYVVEIHDAAQTATLVSQYAVDAVAYHRSRTRTPWGYSDLRNWLNGAFLSKAFSAAQASALVETAVSNSLDRVYILSQEELDQYIYYMGNTTLLTGIGICYTKRTQSGYSIYVNDRGNSSWWLRTPTTGEFAAFVGAGGKIYTTSNPPTSGDNGIRPVIVVRMDAL